MKPDIISSDGEVFERVRLRHANLGVAVSRDGLAELRRRSVGRAHVSIRLPRATGSTSSGKRNAELQGTIRFANQGPSLGPSVTLVGQQLKMRLTDGRTLDFMLCDSGNIINVRVWCCLHRNVRCSGVCGRKHPELDESGGDGELH
jgi:hypothetical protein